LDNQGFTASQTACTH